MDYARLLEKKNSPNDLYEYNKVILERIHGNVLEVGCGTGRIMELIRHKTKDVWGIDIEKSCLEVCRKKGLKTKYGSITKIPFPENTFDFVVCWNVLEHLERDEIMKSAKEMMRVLKPLGKIIVHSQSFDKNFWDTPDHTYPVSKNKIRKLFNEAKNIEFLNYSIPIIRGTLVGRLKAFRLYDFLLAIIPIRTRGMTISIITKNTET